MATAPSDKTRSDCCLFRCGSCMDFLTQMKHSTSNNYTQYLEFQVVSGFVSLPWLPRLCLSHPSPCPPVSHYPPLPFCPTSHTSLYIMSPPTTLSYSRLHTQFAPSRATNSLCHHGFHPPPPCTSISPLLPTFLPLKPAILPLLPPTSHVPSPAASAWSSGESSSAFSTLAKADANPSSTARRSDQKFETCTETSKQDLCLE